MDKRTATWIDRLEGEAHSYACDYAAWWLEGGREPEVGNYVDRSRDDGGRFSMGRADQIAARIRAELPATASTYDVHYEDR